MLPPPPGPPPGMMMPALSRPPMLHSHQLPPPSGASSACRAHPALHAGTAALYACNACRRGILIWEHAAGLPPLYAAPLGGEGKKAPTITGQTTVPKMPRAQANPLKTPLLAINLSSHAKHTAACLPWLAALKSCAGGQESSICSHLHVCMRTGQYACLHVHIPIHVSACAQDDRTITSMVPASVRVRREEPARRTVTGAAAAARSRALTGPEAGFGLAPAAAPATAAAAAAPAAAAAGAVRAPAPRAAAPGFGATSMDRKYQAFLAEMSQLGAV